MNLSEALNAALPELPAQRPKGCPRLDPAIVAIEHIEEGQRIVKLLLPGSSTFYTLAPEDWSLLRLFDGRSFTEIAAAYSEITQTVVDEESVRVVAEQLDGSDLCYRTPQEKNIALMQKLSESRRNQISKRKWDVAHIAFSAWNPDSFLSRVHERFSWLYSRWFTGLTLVMFAFMAYVFIDRWGEIGRDTLKYYTFTEKGVSDLAEFWLLFFVLGFFHESAHGLTSKHYGASVHRMGFHLIYLTPAFFVDLTGAWVYANRWQRVATIAAGVWCELIFCSIASAVWWATPPGTFAHEFSYKIILITGVAVVLVNLNPLIKIDGYYFFSELLDIRDVKERSTAYVSSLVKKYIWRLPADAEYVRPKLRWLFVPYAILSGAYSYMLLFFAARFAGNVFSKFNAQWGFVPALLLAWFIFRGRLRALARFMKTVYLDKKDYIRDWLKWGRLAALGAAALFVFVAPVWRDTVNVRFVLEPGRHAAVRVAVAGLVTANYADEGDVIAAGQPLVLLRDLDLESQIDRVAAELKLANARLVQARLKYADVAAAEHQRQELAERYRMLSQQVSKLQITAPISGVIVTPRLRDLLGTYAKPGTEVGEIADLSEMRARLYIPEIDMRYIRPGESVRLRFDSQAKTWAGVLGVPSPASGDIAEGLGSKQDYKGLRAPRYFVSDVMIPNPGGILRDGIPGTAKVMVGRDSLAGFLWRELSAMASRKFW